MKIHEKFKEMRKKKGLSLKEVFRIQQKALGDQALSYMTLRRIEMGQIPKMNNLYIICDAIGISITELFKDTELEHKMVIRKNERLSYFSPNDKAVFEVISYPSELIFSVELTLLPEGMTPTEQDPDHRGKFEKNLYVTKGSIGVCIDGAYHFLGEKDSITFDSRIPHYYHNESKKKGVCIITQTPKHF